MNASISAFKANKSPQSITTAIVYPNARIHIGWAWECIGADWLARANALFGHPVRLITGMDEHALKVQKAAEAKGLSPKAYCDEMADTIRGTLQKLNIRYDRFIRTSDPDHERVVQSLLQKAFDQGDIYSASYDGLYCEGCEEFKLEKDLLEGLICPIHKQKVKLVQEENYFFRLSKYEEKLKAHFKAHPEFLEPEMRRNEILSFLTQGLKDFSISRSNFSWGIPLPFDPKHITYVWFDALANYITALGYENQNEEWKTFWPNCTHIIGKDISRFHAIYWPAMLMSVGVELPRRIFAHGFINIKGDKMSKTTGNLVAPEDLLEIASSDQVRYYLLADNPFAGDGNFAWDSFAHRVNSDLSNDFGNLLNRSISMTLKYFGEGGVQSTAANASTIKIRDSFLALPAELAATIEAIDPYQYIQAILRRSRELNLLIDQEKPWALAKASDPASLEKLRDVLGTCLEGLRILGIALLAVTPDKAAELFSQLGIDLAPESYTGLLDRLTWGEKNISPRAPTPLFPRVELQEKHK